jgi:hypothetical protein
MNREGHNNVNFFTGIEVERTLAQNQRTLFVVGVQPIETIREVIKSQTTGIDHIYFGANHSVPIMSFDNLEWKEWEDMIMAFLDEYVCTLDVDVNNVTGLVEGPLCEHFNFIPMISVKLPYLQLLGTNATIKIDDKDFAATNKGVWCHNISELLDPNKFTHWSKYTKDKPL